MVGRVEALYYLQLIDSEMDEKKHALRHVERQLDENRKLETAQRELGEKEEALRKLRTKVRSLELDVEEISGKIASTQDMLYGGQITNPKELASLEQEKEYLRRRQSDVEDDALEKMAEVEERESAFEAAKEDLQRMERQWEEAQAELRQEAEELRSRLASLGEQRKETVLTISEQDLAVYEDLRGRKSGQTVVLLEKGICQGCGVALPTSLIQKVRRGQELVQCGSCRRIMYSR